MKRIKSNPIWAFNDYLIVKKVEVELRQCQRRVLYCSMNESKEKKEMRF